MALSEVHMLMYKDLAHVTAVAEGVAFTAQLPEFFSPLSTYHVLLQVVSRPQLVVIDPAVYHMQLSDGRRFVNALASFSEYTSGKQELYQDFGMLQQWRWVDVTLYVKFSGDFPILFVDRCVNVQYDGPLCAGLVGTPSLQLPQYWTDRGCLQRWLRFKTLHETLSTVSDVADKHTIMLCVHVLR